MFYPAVGSLELAEDPDITGTDGHVFDQDVELVQDNLRN
mgnify:FL=1